MHMEYLTKFVLYYVCTLFMYIFITFEPVIGK